MILAINISFKYKIPWKLTFQWGLVPHAAQSVLCEQRFVIKYKSECSSVNVLMSSEVLTRACPCECTFWVSEWHRVGPGGLVRGPLRVWEICVTLFSSTWRLVAEFCDPQNVFLQSCQPSLWNTYHMWSTLRVKEWHSFMMKCSVYGQRVRDKEPGWSRCWLLTASHRFIHGSFLNPNDGGHIFHQNVGGF